MGVVVEAFLTRVTVERIYGYLNSHVYALALCNYEEFTPFKFDTLKC